MRSKIAANTAVALLLAAFAATSPAQTSPACGLQDGNRLPAEVRKDVMLVVGRVNGSQPLRFIVDSEAASPWVISKNLMKRLDLKKLGDQAGFGAGPQLISRPYIEGVDLQVGNKTFSRQHVDVLDLKEVSRFLGEEIDGIIGSAIYRNYKVTLDYRGKSVTLIEDNRCQPAGKRLRMENGNTHFLIRATFKSDYEGIDGAFMVDSGAGPLTVVLNKRGSYLCHSDCLLLPAMGAPVLVRPLPSAKISFEGMEINVSKSYRFVQDSLALQESGAQGVIGGGVLRDFIVTFDWRNHSVFFQEIK